MRRRVLLLLLGLLALAGGAAAVTDWATAPLASVTEEAYHPLDYGLTEQEVCASLGGPPRGVASRELSEALWRDNVTAKEWVGPDVGVYVVFSWEGRLASRRLVQRYRDPSLLARLRRVLSLD